jgi:hypothetical protein
MMQVMNVSTCSNDECRSGAYSLGRIQKGLKPGRGSLSRRLGRISTRELLAWGDGQHGQPGLGSDISLLTLASARLHSFRQTHHRTMSPLPNGRQNNGPHTSSRLSRSACTTVSAAGGRRCAAAWGCWVRPTPARGLPRPSMPRPSPQRPPPPSQS